MSSLSSKSQPPESNSDSQSSNQVAAPSVSLPKGGGAIQGIGEKFDVNPATGTGSMSIPIATSPGRSGYGLQLSLSYDSGAGNGIFGLGWNLSLPQITRKTNKGLPKYRDCEESDVFLLSGAEDLVPVVDESESDCCETQNDPGNGRLIDGVRYRVDRYRPRIEGLFARIERWTKVGDESDVHWRSFTKTNDLTIYGKDADSRITDPEDCSRIFSWLICESRDTKGNVVLYEYKAEDGTGADLCNLHERNRGDANDARRTANRYIKKVRYGNRKTALDACGNRPHSLECDSLEWMFEVVFDYGEHDQDSPKPDEGDEIKGEEVSKQRKPWDFREDPFSTYRSRFEVRTTRRCKRVLMFHHFPNEDGVGEDCLVRSTDFHYDAEDLNLNEAEPVYSRIVSVTQAGYKRKDGGYLRKTLPPLEFEYSRPIVQEKIEEIDSESMQNLPVGLDGSTYRWVDLHGEGISGVLTEQGGNWFYKRNLSSLNASSAYSQATNSAPKVEFAPTEVVRSKPNTSLASGAQFLDLAGDGLLDVAVLDGPQAGFYEHDQGESWESFQPIQARLTHSTRDPNARFIDITGDGQADLLVTENDAMVWYGSEGEFGFDQAIRVARALDEETGPRIVFSDAEQSIYLADMSGDGLTDILRVRNGEVCYWVNLGYGNFGSKIAMDNVKRFDHSKQFDQSRIRPTDIDGSGTTDIIYLHRDGVRLYFNQSGNSFSQPKTLRVYPPVDNLSQVVTVDLLGNGTNCLVWSSSLPGDARRPMRYVNLMGGVKPHLLIKSKNNLGAETEVRYVPSTKFYLQDKRDGKPWITKLPFPVHVVERVITRDRISGNRFVTRYAYHHGYFDGKEREFRGFGMVEQFDTEEFAFLEAIADEECSSNENAESHVPPVLTRTWFHTGANLDRNRISNYYGGFLNGHDRGEYYREPADCCTDKDAKAALGLLPDTVLPCDLTFAEEHEACRALKGSMLRQEVYALDGVGVSCEYPFGHPYTVTEQNFTVRKLQSKGDQRHAVFFTHPREVVNYHYERNPVDPRVSHAMTLDVDDYGNVLKEAAVAYGRRKRIVTVDRFGRKRISNNPELEKLDPHDQSKQTQTQITSTENIFTNSIDHEDSAGDQYLAPQVAGSDTYELTGVRPKKESVRFSFDQWTQNEFAIIRCAQEIPYESKADNADHQKRLIESVRTRYRSNDLSCLLPHAKIQSRMLAGESYKLAFTPGLVDMVYQRSLPEDGGCEVLIPDPHEIFPVDPAQPAASRGGYVDLDLDGHWWIPSGRTFLSPCAGDSPEKELRFASQNFFLDRRYRDPFHTEQLSTETFVEHDSHNLLVAKTHDSVGNSTAANNDYRVLQPKLVTDPNGNRSAVAFDALGMVVGTAVMGKENENLGDSLEGFELDLSDEVIDRHLEAPHASPHEILCKATTRLVYDLFAYHRTSGLDKPQPSVVYIIVRETHDSDLCKGEKTKVQHSFSYSDGFGREIQKKAQAEPSKVPLRDEQGNIRRDRNNQPAFGDEKCPRRWVGSGWTIFNNKGKPVRKFEPFFTDTHRFEPDVCVGVSPTLFYDPVGRMIATIHPNETYEKVVFDSWKQTTWDVNDTVELDPRDDRDVAQFVVSWTNTLTPDWKTWYQTRIADSFCIEDLAYASTYDDIQNPKKKQRLTQRILKLEVETAKKASAHANTPTLACLDNLGRTFLTLTHNRVDCEHHDQHGREEFYPTRFEIDIEGNQRCVRDSVVQDDDRLGRIIMQYSYDMLGNRIHQSSMEAGERWSLNDVTGKPIRAWDSRGHQIRSEYDEKRRPLRSFLTQGNASELLTERLVYGEQHPEATKLNLRDTAYLQLDQAGAVSTEQFDFKGNPVWQARRIAKEFKVAFGWEAVDSVLPTQSDCTFAKTVLDKALSELCDTETYRNNSSYDAMNRPIEMTTPHTEAMKPNVIRHRFNEANLLDRVDVNLRQAKVGEKTDWTPFVNNINYDAKGQRQRIEYGNGAVTTYNYDPSTFRLQRMQTRRFGKAFQNDNPNPALPDCPGEHLQNLNYIYDPVGNITHIQDDAQQTIFFRNKRVEPSNDYTYDAIYRLIEAKGREHLGQVIGAPIPHSHDDGSRVGLLDRNDRKAMGTYVERYVYDNIGNFKEMHHRGVEPQNVGWTRSYEYNEASSIEPSKYSNRLSFTQIRGETPANETYDYDIHGNMTSMPHLDAEPTNGNMHWDFQDQLTRVDLLGGRKAHYIYDTKGQRVRKVIWKSDKHFEERLYLGGFEIYRKRDADQLLERETLHVMDDQQRIAMVETRTADTAGKDKSPVQLIRYQHSNHLDSASFELDQRAQLISYEEYTPFGSSSYRAVRSEVEALSRYRFTGKERDEESGFCYHGFRFYAPWLGRWTSTDPIGIDDHKNLYVYTRCNPVNTTDPTGLWSWRKVAVVAAAVTVGVVVTAVTAGAAAPLIAGAVASVGITGATGAGVATVAVGAVAGAAGAGATELTKQIASGESVSGKKVLTEMGKGALIGGAFSGLGLAARSSVGQKLIAGAANSSIGKTVSSMAGKASGSLLGQKAGAAARVVGQGLGKLTEMGENAGIAVGKKLFNAIGDAGASRGSLAITQAAARGAAVVNRFAATRSIEASLETMTVFRGTDKVMETTMQSRTGYLGSDAATTGYLENGEDLYSAYANSSSAHAKQLKVWGAADDYVQAHGEFGHEISVFGPRSMVSVTTKQEIAENFANGGQVYRASVLKAQATRQSLATSTESEFLINHLLKATPVSK